MNIENELKELKLEDEKISNRYVLITMAVALLVTLICEILNEFNIFHVEKNIFRICTVATCVIVLFPCIYYKIPQIIKPEKLKYIILFHVLTFTFIVMVLLNVHATLILMLPLLISTHYHSKRILSISAIGTGVIAIIAPFLSIKFGTIDDTFFGLSHKTS